MQYVDYRKVIQDRLNNIYPDLFEVTTERNIQGDGDKVSVIVRQLTGSILGNSSSIPYQLDIFTNDPDKLMDIFTAYAKKYSNTSFNSTVNEGTEESPIIKTYLVIEYINTPTVMEAIVDAYNTKMSRLVVFCNLTFLKDISNVKEIKIDGENIEFTSSNLSYAANLHENRISGEQLNKSKKREASTGLTFSMVNKDTIFTRKALNIMFGLIDGNTKFNVYIELTNGIKANLPMIVNACQFSASGKGQVSLPNLNISLSLYDNRGE